MIPEADILVQIDYAEEGRNLHLYSKSEKGIQITSFLHKITEI
jgi:hypothetical protein